VIFSPKGRGIYFRDDLNRSIRLIFSFILHGRGFVEKDSIFPPEIFDSHPFVRFFILSQ